MAISVWKEEGEGPRGCGYSVGKEEGEGPRGCGYSVGKEAAEAIPHWLFSFLAIMM